VKEGGDPVVRPQFGPPLPELVEQRFGVRRRWLLVGILVLALVLLAVWLARRVDDDRSLFVHRTDPAFTVLYPPSVLHRATPRPGEIVRLEGRRPGIRAEVTVRPLRLPAYPGDVERGLLPVYGERYAQQLARTTPGLFVIDEGRARVNDATGYQLGLRHGRTWGRDVLLLDPESRGRSGVVVTLRRTYLRRKLGASALALDEESKRAFRSFRWGTERP